jgi:hypothetical protein
MAPLASCARRAAWSPLLVVAAAAAAARARARWTLRRWPRLEVCHEPKGMPWTGNGAWPWMDLVSFCQDRLMSFANFAQRCITVF